MAILVPLNNRGPDCENQRDSHTLMVISIDAEVNDMRINICSCHVNERPVQGAEWLSKHTWFQVVHG